MEMVQVTLLRRASSS